MQPDHRITEPGRWERLFADMETAFEAAERSAWDSEVADRVRGEVGRLRTVDRLRGALGHPIELSLRTGDCLGGVLREVGPDWLLVMTPAPRSEVLVALPAVCAVSGLGAQSTQPGSEGRVAARLELRYALRRLARDRAAVAMTLLSGDVLAGTCDRVGADFVEVAEHASGEQRRASAVRRVRTVPLGALVLVRQA